jgi:hypothetical protein
MRTFWKLGLISLLALPLSACTTGEMVPAGSRYMVMGKQTPFYKYGPAQTFGADFNLKEGQRVTMIERGFGYSRVMTDDGVTGYVPSEEVTPAPPEPKPEPPSKPKRSWFSSGGAPKRSNVRGTPGSPLFDVNDVPLPEMPQGGDGNPKPAPKFRY